MNHINKGTTYRSHAEEIQDVLSDDARRRADALDYDPFRDGLLARQIDEAEAMRNTLAGHLVIIALIAAVAITVAALFSHTVRTVEAMPRHVEGFL